MADYDFIPAQAYQELSEDPGQQFLELAAVAETNFNARLKSAQGAKADTLRKAYIGQLNAVSEELGFGELPLPAPGIVNDVEWSNFQGGLTAVKTKIRIRSHKSAGPDSVLLSRIGKARIEQEIDRLRRIVDESDLSDKKKEALRTKLDELVEELHRQRLSFAKLAAIAAAIAAFLGGSTTTMANGPRAMETIVRILQYVGEEKQAEELEQARLAAPPKALPRPENESEDKLPSNKAEGS